MSINLLNTDQAAEILRVSRRTLEGWRSRGQGPAVVKLGSLCYYRMEDLEAFVLSRVKPMQPVDARRHIRRKKHHEA